MIRQILSQPAKIAIQLQGKQVSNFSQKNSQYYMELEEKYGCHNYHPLPVVLERGEGVHVWDVEGNKYLDFLAGYGAVNQGHVHPKIKQVFLDNVGKLNLASRAFYNKNLGITEQFMHDTFGYDKSLFMNSGCEAVESSIKFARRWAYEVKKVPSNQARVIFALGNFWGRSLAACGSSEDPDRNLNFGPYDTSFDLVEYNNIEAMRKQMDSSPNYAAVVLESIQGEKGVVIPDAGYIKQVKQLCEERNIKLIIDEVQSGLGRTGKLLNHYWDEIRPDMVVMAKSLSGGFYPVSCVLADNEIMDCIRPGEHGSTFGGNPVAAAIAQAGIEVLIEDGMLENSLKMGEKLLNGIKDLHRPYFKDVRGRGLWVAIEMDEHAPFTAWELCLQMKQNGLISKPTHETTIRLSPPLVINEQQINQALEILDTSISQIEKK